jgi:hypothetical protein
MIKRLFLLLTLCSLSIFGSQAATVSGTITDSLSGQAAGRKVYLCDSVSYYVMLLRDSTITNSSGVYSFTIPGSTSTGRFGIKTLACGQQYYSPFMTYSGSSLTINLTTCAPITASGTVTHSTFGPVAGIKVYLMDSSASLGVTYRDSTLTNSSGKYSFTVATSVSSYRVYANACGSRFSSPIYYTLYGSFTINLLLSCPYTIGGAVSKQGGGVAASAKVYLIAQYYDTVGSVIDTLLVALDSTTTNSAGQYSFSNPGYWIMPQRIKAALQPSDPSYWNYLPTYHDSSLRWSGAAIFGSSAWTSGANNLSVSLRSGTNPGGPGFIGGSVMVGANKSTAVGDPLAKRILLLTTVNDVAVGYTYSNASGAFSFSNLAYGTYKLFGDAGGKANPPLLITLSAGAASVSNVVFEENNKKFEGHIGNVGVHTQNLDAVHLYPNPAGAFITLNGLNSIQGSKTIVVKNVAGAVVYSTETEANDAFTISTEKLPAGVYLLQLNCTSGVRNMRFVKN